MIQPLPEAVRRAWPSLVIEAPTFGTGLIHATMLGSLGERSVVVQRVHPIFGERVHEDIEAVTSHVEARGLPTPRLIRTADGALCVRGEDDAMYRVYSRIFAESKTRIESPSHAEEAGRLVARFHGALEGFDHVYAFTRPHVHDVGARLDLLRRAVESNRDHRLYDEVAGLEGRIAAGAGDLVGVDDGTKRHAHGDLKISNLLFDEGGRGVCLVDLDTCARMLWAFELGDALRNWCNPSGEDVTEPGLDLEILERALVGYRSGADSAGFRVPADDRDQLARGTETIAAELAIRFLTDALEERYFGWDAAKYPTRGDHNLVRAKGQWALAESVRRSRLEVETIAQKTL